MAFIVEQTRGRGGRWCPRSPRFEERRRAGHRGSPRGEVTQGAQARDSRKATERCSTLRRLLQPPTSRASTVSEAPRISLAPREPIAGQRGRDRSAQDGGDHREREERGYLDAVHGGSSRITRGTRSRDEDRHARADKHRPQHADLEPERREGCRSQQERRCRQRDRAPELDRHGNNSNPTKGARTPNGSKSLLRRAFAACDLEASSLKLLALPPAALKLQSSSGSKFRRRNSSVSPRLSNCSVFY